MVVASMSKLGGRNIGSVYISQKGKIAVIMIMFFVLYKFIAELSLASFVVVLV